MNKKRLSFIISIVIAASLLISCAKSKETKLIGKWSLLSYNSTQVTDTTIWEFKADGTLWIMKNDTVHVDTANYDFQTHSMRYYVEIVGLGPTKTDDDWDGNYHVDKLTNVGLILQCQSPFLRWEFLKNKTK